MSSKTIYHFVYETTNLVNGKVYRGVHLTDNLDDGYLGSGTRFIKALNKYGKDKFKREIIFWAFDRDSADWAEEQLVSEEWLLENKHNSYNIAVGGTRKSCYHLSENGEIKHRTENKVSAINLETGQTVQISKEEFDNNNYVGVTSGFMTALNLETNKIEYISCKEFRSNPKYGSLLDGKLIAECPKTGKRFYIDSKDPRIKAEGLIHVNGFNENEVSALDKDGNVVRISKEEFDNNDDYVGVTKGKFTAKDKDGNNYLIDRNDPRYISGELKHVSYSIISVKDKDGNCFKISKDDPTLQTENYVGQTAGYTTVYDLNGNTVYISIEELNANPHLYKRILSGRTRVYSELGEERLMYKDDERILSGEYKTRQEWLDLGNTNMPIRISPMKGKKKQK